MFSGVFQPLIDNESACILQYHPHVISFLVLLNQPSKSIGMCPKEANVHIQIIFRKFQNVLKGCRGKAATVFSNLEGHHNRY